MAIRSAPCRSPGKDPVLRTTASNTCRRIAALCAPPGGRWHRRILITVLPLAGAWLGLGALAGAARAEPPSSTDGSSSSDRSQQDTSSSGCSPSSSGCSPSRSQDGLSDSNDRDTTSDASPDGRQDEGPDRSGGTADGDSPSDPVTIDPSPPNEDTTGGGDPNVAPALAPTVSAMGQPWSHGAVAVPTVVTPSVPTDRSYPLPPLGMPNPLAPFVPTAVTAGAGGSTSVCGSRNGVHSRSDLAVLTAVPAISVALASARADSRSAGRAFGCADNPESRPG